MPLYTDFQEMVTDIRQHNREHGHEIIQADDPMRRRVGYSCADCDVNDGWECSLTAIRDITDPDLSIVFRSQGGRERLLALLNEHATDRFFGSPVLGEGELEPGELDRLQGVFAQDRGVVERAEEALRVSLESWRATRFDREDPV